MKMECPDHGIVDPVEHLEDCPYVECGVSLVWLMRVPVLRCPVPKCRDYLGVSIQSISHLHSVIAIALLRKRTTTDREKDLIRKVPLYPVEESKRWWWYRRHGQLIECYRTEPALPATEATSKEPE